MSIEVMAQVWKLKLPNHLVLLLIAMADWADDDGGNIYPSVAHLAWKTGQSERGAQRGLKALRDRGIAIKVGVKTHGNVEYRLDFTGVSRKGPWVPRTEDSRSDNMSYPAEPSEPSDTSDGDAEVGHVVPAEADTGVLQTVSQPSVEPPVNRQEPNHPEWFKVASAVETWDMSYEKAEAWRVMAKVTTDLAERKAYGLGAWMTPKKIKEGRKAYDTWQAWCREDRDRDSGSNRGAQRQPVRAGSNFKGYGE